MAESIPLRLAEILLIICLFSPIFWVSSNGEGRLVFIPPSRAFGFLPLGINDSSYNFYFMGQPEPEKLISIEEFSKVHLRIGKVIRAERVRDMNKVFRATVDLGNEQRELAVGGATYYNPENFIGRTVVVCTNLEPKKIGTIISRGMLLAADGSGGKPIFLTVSEDTPLGAPVH